MATNNINSDKKFTETRTRFAPSPTGYMHIGNLRTALYAYLFARATNGKFVLRIEDTDQKRYVEGAVDVIYRTLKTAKIHHDEGPDVGGNYGPYVQSDRKHIYKEYAEKLVELGHGYYCFCQKEEAHDDGTQENKSSLNGYPRTCRNLSKVEVQAKLASGMPYVIRQKMPLVGTTVYNDAVFGRIKVNNEVLEDQVLLKSDGYPTYNFANVIDDHLMGITHILRGSEYIPSTPKYVLLYQSYGWDVPEFVHLPLIMGKDEQGNVSKLSKRFGSTSFDELVKEGYLPEAIINFISLLGWSPKSEREIFSIEELEQIFNIEGISKSPSIFDYKKLKWMNSEYIKAQELDKLAEMVKPFVKEMPEMLNDKWTFFVKSCQDRMETLADINALIEDLVNLPDYEAQLLLHEKNKIAFADAKQVIETVIEKLDTLKEWTYDSIHDMLHALKDEKGWKMGYLMWPLRISLTGKMFSPSATEYLYLLGKDESISRFNVALNKINKNI